MLCRTGLPPLIALGLLSLTTAASPPHAAAAAPPQNTTAPPAAAGSPDAPPDAEASTSPATSRFPAVDNRQAWSLLPQEHPMLPIWARTLIEPLPKTTAAMLALDELHRAHNPLGAVLAGKLRWSAADALACEYAKACAAADLRRAGFSDEQLQRLAAAAQDPGDPDQRAVAFARKLTLAGYTISDAEFAELLQQYGPDAVVAIVHTVACANFQNRIYLALGLSAEPGGPLPPVELHPDLEARLQVPVPPRPDWAALSDVQLSGPGSTLPPEWRQKSVTDLDQALDHQKQRSLRIPLPDPERIDSLPPESREQARKILWNTVSAGYQPRMTRMWFDCLQAYYQEANPNRVFTNSVFWVITRTNECFY